MKEAADRDPLLRQALLIKGPSIKDAVWDAIGDVIWHAMAVGEASPLDLPLPNGKPRGFDL